MNLNKKEGQYYIHIKNMTDFSYVQLELFQKNCKWIGGGIELHPKPEYLEEWMEKNSFPMYLMLIKYIQDDHWILTVNSIENVSKYGDFDKSRIVDSSLLLRKQKLKKLNELYENIH